MDSFKDVEIKIKEEISRRQAERFEKLKEVINEEDKEKIRKLNGVEKFELIQQMYQKYNIPEDLSPIGVHHFSIE